MSMLNIKMLITRLKFKIQQTDNGNVHRAYIYV